MGKLQGVLKKNFEQTKILNGTKKDAIKSEILSVERKLADIKPNEKSDDIIEIGRGQGTLAKGFRAAQTPANQNDGTGILKNQLNGYLKSLRHEFENLSANENGFAPTLVYSMA